ncbi:hypothetical protein [Gordonia crocea]|uniref:Mce associated membrane protein n=1 Tax=Gordonia crocea TaxID=589162 RepID=A0A7I9V1P5_9ACTN|nr:hypothetical protein [Gordonia crocea]GED99367.1 hypothetical protein nbrc107697_34060 [Gordonia crocea]
MTEGVQTPASRDRELVAAERRERQSYLALAGGTESRWPRLLLVLAALAAVTGLVAAVIAGRGPSDDDFQRAAAQRVGALLTVDPGHPDRAKRILAGATGEFHDEFAQSADAYTRFVRSAGTVSDGRVTGTGLTARRDNSAEVLVAASVDLAASRTAPARSTDFRLRVVVVDEGGAFKLAKVQYLP